MVTRVVQLQWRVEDADAVVFELGDTLLVFCFSNLQRWNAQQYSGVERCAPVIVGERAALLDTVASLTCASRELQRTAVRRIIVNLVVQQLQQ